MGKLLVAYFSASGVTERAAKALAKAADVDLYEIRPEIPYTDADLDWTNPASRSSAEMKKQETYPALADTSADIGAYECILVGFPIWWYQAPTIINRFLESYDFSGKKIVLFATSGGSGFGKTAEKLRGSVAPDAQIIEGELLNGTLSEEKLAGWVKSLNL